MRTTRPALGKYICGMVASLIIFLAGGWLILAPFALGYQPYGADWVSQTTNDFATGIPVAVVALASFVLFFYSLLGALRAAGVLTARMRPVAQVPAPYQAQASAPQALVPFQSDLDKTLATLAAALAADLAARRQAGSDQQSDQAIDQVVN
jgi:glucan phosphoethanolaminetransferase (alkaline phosphatase superfamily)